MNPSSSTTGEMKEGWLHSPNPHHRGRGHIPSSISPVMPLLRKARSSSIPSLVPLSSIGNIWAVGAREGGQGVHIHTCSLGNSALNDTKHSAPSTWLPCKVPIILRSWNCWGNTTEAIWTYNPDHIISVCWLQQISLLTSSIGTTAFVKYDLITIFT